MEVLLRNTFPPVDFHIVTCLPLSNLEALYSNQIDDFCHYESLEILPVYRRTELCMMKLTDAETEAEAEARVG